MEENKNNNTAAAAETAIDSIRKLMESVGNDDALRQKLQELLVVLTGNATDSRKEKASEPEKETPLKDDVRPVEMDDDTSSDSCLSDIFNEDALAGMVVGFVAGAAVVGGGVLLHKLIAND